MHVRYRTRLHKSYLLTIPSSCHSKGEALSLGTHTRDGIEDYAAAVAAAVALVQSEGNGAASSMDKMSGSDSARARLALVLQHSTSCTAVVALKICSCRQHTTHKVPTLQTVRRRCCYVASIHIIQATFSNMIYFDFVRCAVLKYFPPAASSQAQSQLVLRHQTWCQLDVVVIYHLLRLSQKLLAACCRLEDLVCWFGWDDRSQL